MHGEVSETAGVCTAATRPTERYIQPVPRRCLGAMTKRRPRGYSADLEDDAMHLHSTAEAKALSNTTAKGRCF